MGLILEKADACQDPPVNQGHSLHILLISLANVTLGHGVTAADETSACWCRERWQEQTAASHQLAPHCASAWDGEAAGGTREGIYALGAANHSHMKIFWICKAPNKPVFSSFPGAEGQWVIFPHWQVEHDAGCWFDSIPAFNHKAPPFLSELPTDHAVNFWVRFNCSRCKNCWLLSCLFRSSFCPSLISQLACQQCCEQSEFMSSPPLSFWKVVNVKLPSREAPESLTWLLYIAVRSVWNWK